jgi:hypothetical protein
VIENVNFALDVGASVSGQVTAIDHDNVPIPAIVGAYTSDGTNVTRALSVSTDADGTFTFEKLPPGTYYVAAYFGAGAGCVLYASSACATALNPTVAELPNATPIVLVSGGSISGVNIGLRVDLFHNGFE